jgi:hypothetical protein
VISGWAWEGTAPGAAACGVSDREGNARRAAEEWLTDHPDGTAVLDSARLADGTATLSAWWAPGGQAQRSRRLRDGRITWARVPPDTGVQRVRSGLAQWFFPHEGISFLTLAVSRANSAFTCGNVARVR